MSSCSMPVQKQGKWIYQNTIDLVLSIYEDDEFSCQMPGKKDYQLALQKEFINRYLLFYAPLELPSRKKILMSRLVFQILHISTKMVCTCWVFRYSFCMCIFFIGIPSMQGWTATARQEVRRKESQKRLTDTENLLRKNLQLKDVC